MSKQTTTLAPAAAPTLQRAHETLAIIGLGYVGLPLAIRAAEKGFPVIGFDIDAGKIAAIKDASIPYITERERTVLQDMANFTATDAAADLAKAATFIVCVPTPVSGTHEPDLRPLEGACRTLAAYLKKGDLVVIESTVNPGVCEEIVIPILERRGLKAEKDFFLAHCPERINPGDRHWDVRTIPRVIGGAGPESLLRATQLYRSIIDGDIVPMQTLKEAEAVKMVENAFRDINIAFVNELAMSFDKAGIDLISVIRGASTKPFAFMPHLPGCGVGGHCIPVDPYYLIRYGHENGFTHKFLMTARSINNRMPGYTVSLVANTLRRKRKQLKGAQVALLGLSYKRDIADERESPAHEIRRQLEERGAIVRTYDPYVPKGSTHDTLDAALESVDAAVIATDHSEFRNLTPFHFMRGGVDIVVDGRNCLNRDDFIESGIIYSGIGRAAL
jgi:UDP-N-acetyl-D-glucosamine dehydrogenase